MVRNQSSVHTRKANAETQRRKLILALVLRHLHDNGYAVTSEAMEKEAASLLLPAGSLAPNMNLMYIVHEFEEFYKIKMDRAPALVRRVAESERRVRVASAASNDAALEARLAAHAARAAAEDAGVGSAKQKLSHDETPVDTPAGLRVSGYAGGEEGVADFEERLMKPLPSYADDPDMRDFARLISRDIFTANPNVRWTDVAGLETAKRLLEEAVVMPIK